MDFEFATFGQNIILISGAMSKYHIESQIFKLQGNPLVLKSGGSITRFYRNNVHILTKQLTKRLKKKPDTLNSILKELQESINITGKFTLRPEYIINYLIKNGQIPILVLWNGSNDTRILKRLNITQVIPVMLNMTVYDEYKNSQYYLKLTHSENDELICSHNIGCVEKNGRMLSLSETHSVICTVNHPDITNTHDPVTDVLYTKCIFNYLIRLEGGYTNIFNKVLELY